VLAEGSVSALLKHGAADHLFMGNESEVYDFIREFVKEYGVLPKEETIETHTGQSLVKATEPAGYYYDLLGQRYTEQKLKVGMTNAQKLLKADVKDIDGASKVLAEMLMEVSMKRQVKQISDFRFALADIIGEYATKLNASENYGLQLGWPYIDQKTGGIVAGDLVSFVGKVMQGKTWMMLHSAHHGWNQANQALLGGAEDVPDQSRLFISMEIKALPIKQRLAAMQAHIPMTQLKQAELSTINLKGLKQELGVIQGYRDAFWVVDGNLTATVEDIWMMVRQLKPSAVYIDGAYLLKHPTERDRFVRVAENCDLLKTQVCDLVPTVASWQFQTKGKQVKKGEKLGLDDIGYTKAIAELSSIVCGLFQEDSVETLIKKQIDLLKGRSGETGQWETHWDFQTMNFSQYIEKAPEELNFLD
jgi:hypothetical protein